MQRRPAFLNPDLTLGHAQDALDDGATLLGRVGEEAVLLVRVRGIMLVLTADGSGSSGARP
jgi:hypothetical protein